MPEDLLPALAEWRDARQAIFDGHTDRASWDRLAVAEHRLMDVAKALPKCQP